MFILSYARGSQQEKKKHENHRMMIVLNLLFVVRRHFHRRHIRIAKMRETRDAITYIHARVHCVPNDIPSNRKNKPNTLYHFALKMLMLAVELDV